MTGGSPFSSDVRALWAESPVETCILLLLLAGLAWAPFWLGADRPIPWGVNGILFPGLVIAYEASLLARGARHPFAARRIAAPAALFAAILAWVAVQTSTWTPATLIHPIWPMASDVLDRPLAGSISVNRGATALALMRLLTDASVLWLSMQLCRDARRAYVALQTIAGVVAAYSLYGLALTAAYAGAIPFFEAPDVGGLVRATFVNRNNFATYAGLGLVVSIALTLRLYRHEVPDAAGLGSYRIAKFVEATGRRGWRMIGLVLVILVALIGSASRGGLLSAALGFFALIAMSTTRRRRRRTQQIEAIAFVTLLLVVTFLAFGDAVLGRIAAAGVEDANRISVYIIVARSILDAPLLGFGYGTFADVFPMYRDHSINVQGVWDMAHNTYLEVWQGLGLLFGTALIAAPGLLILQCVRGAVRRRRDATPALIAAACGLLVGVHALVDFSVQIQAVSLTFMALLGAGVAGSVSSQDKALD